MGYDTIQGRYILNMERFGAIQCDSIWYGTMQPDKVLNICLMYTFSILN